MTKQDISKENFVYRQWYALLPLVLLGFLLCIGTVLADDITPGAANTGFHLLEEPVNPHAIALGYAGTALATKGFSYYNPALPFLMGRTYLSAEFGTYPRADLRHAQLEAALSLANWFFGLSLHNESIEDIYETDFWGSLPYYDAPFSAQFSDISFDVGYSRWEDFAVALCVNGMQDRIHDEYAYALSFSAGAVINPIPQKLYVGLSLLEVGFSTPMLGGDSGSVWGEGERLPFSSRLGVTWTDALKEMPYTLACDIVYRNVRDRADAFTRHIQDRFSVPVGCELWPVPPLAVRIGKRFNFPTEILNFGIGLRLDPLTVDASFVIPKLVDDAEIKWLTSITYYLIPKKKKVVEKHVTIIKPLIISPADTVSDTSAVHKDSVSAGSEGIPEGTGAAIDTADTVPVSGDSSVIDTGESAVRIKQDTSDTGTQAIPSPQGMESTDTASAPADSAALQHTPAPGDSMPPGIVPVEQEAAEDTTRHHSREAEGVPQEAIMPSSHLPEEKKPVETPHDTIPPQ